MIWSDVCSISDAITAQGKAEENARRRESDNEDLESRLREAIAAKRTADEKAASAKAESDELQRMQQRGNRCSAD